MTDFAGPPEPIVRPAEEDSNADERVEVLVPAEGTVETVPLGKWYCNQYSHLNDCSGLAPEHAAEPPARCMETDCNQQTFYHGGELSEKDVQVAVRSSRLWYPPSGISDADYGDLWADVRDYIRAHWDTSEAFLYDGLTAFALSTWIREELEFLPHLMLMGKTTGGKTRLLNTLARVTYRGRVVVDATAASMFRLIDEYDVSYFISEYHGLEYETQNQIDAIIRAGQKRGEKIDRAEQTSQGYEPDTFDPFTHVAVGTQYDVADDILNRCIQVRSQGANRRMPMTFDEDRADQIRNRLIYARYRLLDSEEWKQADAKAYNHLAEANIWDRTHEKLRAILAVGYVWNQVDALEPFIEEIVSQDTEAAADSEDARFIEALRDLVIEEIGDKTVLGGGDPMQGVEIPLSDITNRYNAMTEQDKSPSWAGHVRKRLGFEKAKRADGTVISDPNLKEKLKRLCDELNLDYAPLETHRTVEPLSEADQYRADCSDCGELSQLTHSHAVEGYHMCADCADEWKNAEA